MSVSSSPCSASPRLERGQRRGRPAVEERRAVGRCRRGRRRPPAAGRRSRGRWSRNEAITRIFAVAAVAFARVRWLLGRAGARDRADRPGRRGAAARRFAGDAGRSAFFYRAHDGRRRPAWLLLPSSYDGRPIPLVISPHGRGVSAAVNARFWGNLPGEGDFAVVNPGGEGRRLHQYSWGDPGEIDDLARMPAIVRRLGVRVDPHRIYAIGGSMGGQETLLLVAQHPQLLAGAVAFDPATDMARRYRDFAHLRDGRTLQRLARDRARRDAGAGSRARIAQRSPDAYVDAIAFSGVPLQLYWSVRDRIISDQVDEAALLAAEIRTVNPAAQLWDFEGAWNHTAEMQSRPPAAARARALRAPAEQRRAARCRRSLGARRCRPSDERGLEVGEQVVGRLDPDREADEVAAAARTARRRSTRASCAPDARSGSRRRRATRRAGRCFVRATKSTASSSDSSRNETMPPKSRIWLRATSWPGWVGRPG